jgi:Leucine-rich repeat (LRR) protein
MEDSPLEKILQLLSTATEPNIELALALEKSQKIDLEFLWEDLRELHLIITQRLGTKKQRAKLLAVETLSLINQSVKEWPIGLRQLKNLNSLDLTFNKLEAIPDEIGDLPQLEMLYIANNFISTISEQLAKLTKLKDLNLNHNALKVWPDCFSELAALKELKLVGNQLESVPKEIAKLQNLEKLNLRENKLSALPQSISALKKLKWLNLQGNPKLFANFKEVEAMLPWVTIKW